MHLGHRNVHPGCVCVCVRARMCFHLTAHKHCVGQRAFSEASEGSVNSEIALGRKQRLHHERPQTSHASHSSEALADERIPLRVENSDLKHALTIMQEIVARQAARGPLEVRGHIVFAIFLSCMCGAVQCAVDDSTAVWV